MTRNNPVIYCEHLSEDGERVRESFCMDKDKFVKIDHDSQEIVQYANKKLFWDDYHSYGFAEFIPNIFFYLGYYLHPMRKKLGGGLMTFLVTNVKGQESVVVKGVPYNGFHGTSRIMYSMTQNQTSECPFMTRFFGPSMKRPRLWTAFFPSDTLWNMKAERSLSVSET